MAPGTEVTTTGRTANPDSADRGSALFVWGIWILLFANALAFIRHYGCNVPCCDDWALVPAVTGNEPITLSYLWSQHNEHRIPLPRLVTLGLAQLTGFDVRAAMYLNAALLVAHLVLFRKSGNPMGGAFLRSGLLAASLYLPWVRWAWSYYGSPIPNTILAKSPPLGDQGGVGSILQRMYQAYLLRAAQVFGPIYFPGPWTNANVPGIAYAGLDAVFWIYKRKN
jgi:hypothetical protein